MKSSVAIPAVTHKFVNVPSCDVDVALIGFYPSNNGTIIWRLNYLKKRLDARGYACVLLTGDTVLKTIFKTIKKAKKVILCRPSMDDRGNSVIRFCLDEHKPFIIDLDDALFHGSTQNDGSFMSACSTFEDQTSVYNNIADCYIFAELMTVSTPKIQNLLSEKYDVKPILLPNSIDVSLCREPRYEDHTGLRLLYTSGTATHLHDLSTVFLDLLSFLKRHQDVSLTILGDSIDDKKILWASNRVRKIPYIKFTNMLNVYADHDLVLVPLEHRDFNNAKSNIKYIESGAVGVPVLASDCTEFKNAIVDGVNGFLYHDNFIEKMEYIYNNRHTLKNVGKAAYHDVKKNHSTQCGIPPQFTEWLDNY